MTIFLHNLEYFFSVGLLRTKFQVTNFLFQVDGNMVEENIMYQELQKVCREKVCRSIATYMYLTYSL